MPGPDEQVQKKAQQIKSPYISLKQDKEQKLRGDSIMDTYAHDQEKMQYYYKTAEKKGATPEQLESASKFKKSFKALGRFLTGMPNYGRLYKKTNAKWETFNLDQVSQRLRQESDQILYENLPEEELQEPQMENNKQGEKKKIPAKNFYEAFSSMAKNGHFFKTDQAQDPSQDLMQMENDLTAQIANLKDKKDKKNKKEKGRKDPSLPELEKKLRDVREAMSAQKQFKQLQGQLNYFQEGNGSLSSQHISDLKDKFFFKGSVSSYIFKLVTGMDASQEALQYAQENHPKLLQMIYYSQILNQMDIAINKITLFEAMDGKDLGILHLEEYTFLQAQKKETNRLLTELSAKTELKKSFQNKFSEALKKEDTKAENRLEKEGNQEKDLAVNPQFIQLYKEYTNLSEKDKEQFLFKNLKNILNVAAEICKNQPEEKVDKEEPRLASVKSNIRSNVETIAADPFAYDHFLNKNSSTGLDSFMKAIAYLVPDSAISKENTGENLAENLSEYYWKTYITEKKEDTKRATQVLEEPGILLLNDSGRTQDYLRMQTEAYSGFHSKKLEKYNNLYSVIKKIVCDPKTFDALMTNTSATFEQKQFDELFYLITLDHALYTLENQNLQKDKYYTSLDEISQELDTSLPILENWYKKYPAEVAQKEKEEVSQALSEQIESLRKEVSTKDKEGKIAAEDCQNLIDNLKKFLTEFPVNAEDENAEIYNLISEALTSPYAAAVIEKPENLEHFISLTDAIMKKDQVDGQSKAEALTSAFASYPVIVKALQAEQKHQQDIATELKEKEQALKDASGVENVPAEQKESEQQVKDEIKDEIKDKIPKAKTMGEFQSGTLRFYPDEKEYREKVPVEKAAPEETERQKIQERKAQSILNQQIKKQLNKIQEEQNIAERQSSLQSIGKLDLTSTKELEPLKIQAKKTGFITTIAAWLSKLFKKKTTNAMVTADTDLLMQEIDNSGSLVEVTDEKISEAIKKAPVQKSAKKEEVKVENINYENDINEELNDLILEEHKEEVQEKQEEKNVEPVQDQTIVDANNDQEIDEQMKQLEKENDIEEENKKKEIQSSEEATVGDIFKNYNSENKDNQDVNADIEKLQKELKQEEYARFQKANNNQINESRAKSSIQQSSKINGQIVLDTKNLPRTFQEMRNTSYMVTAKMEKDFIAVQKTLIKRSNHKDTMPNAQHMPEYYVNFHQLYDAMKNNPENVLLIKLVNLLKCNDPKILMEERKILFQKYCYNKTDKQIDSYLLKHLNDRAALLKELHALDDKYAKQKLKPCGIENNHFKLLQPEFQDLNHPNICWSIALSNLLACQGIKVSSQLIRASRVENAPFELDPDYINSSTIHSQSGRGEAGNVRRGFNQISHLDMVKNYHCEESNFEDAQRDDKKLEWDNWFVSKLKEAFGGENFKANHSSAMTLTNDKHVITILGFDNLKTTEPGNTILYVHDSLYPAQEPFRLNLKGLKKYFIDEEKVPYTRTGVCYLKKINKNL